MWRIETHSGSAADFHHRALPHPLEPTVWWFTVQQSALILGSAQPLDHIDLGACEQAGIEVVRRRSGGGAVLVEPHDIVWVDVILPIGHAQWSNDVGAAGGWLAEVWIQAFKKLGVTGLHAHLGPLITNQWSRQVCFAGLGGGEVVNSQGQKLVGVSQRRTRDGARFQCGVYRQWRPERLSSLFNPPAPPPEVLADLVATVSVDCAAIRTAFEVALREI